MNKKRTRRLGIRLNEDEYIRLQNYMERTEMNASDCDLPEKIDSKKLQKTE